MKRFNLVELGIMVVADVFGSIALFALLLHVYQYSGMHMVPPPIESTYLGGFWNLAYVWLFLSWGVLMLELGKWLTEKEPS